MDMEYPEWAAVGRRLGAIGRCSQWWLGDWIRFGNAKFGERYARATQITHYDMQTLMNMVYVASRFEISRRRENLSWSHHAELAPLDVKTQDVWLDRALVDRLSVADLRLALRSLRRDPGSAGAGSEPSITEAQTTSASLVCPNCGHAMPLPSAALRMRSTPSGTGDYRPSSSS